MTIIEYFYYISSGELNRMYTLRVSYTEMVGSGEYSYQVVRDHYCCNLSTDKDKAYEKAKQYVSNRVDLFKGSSHSAKLIDPDKVPTLEDIYRRSQEELEAARLAAEKTAQAAAISYEERMHLIAMDKIDKIKLGLWPFGQYREQPIGGEIVLCRSILGVDRKPDLGYIMFMMNIKLDAEDNTDKNHAAVMESLQNYLKYKFKFLLELPEPNDEFYGEEKKREDFQLTKVAEFSFQNNYAYNAPDIFIQKFVKDSGELIIYKGTSPLPCEIGETILAKATIKEHTTYKGSKQTTISRPKFLNKTVDLDLIWRSQSID